MKNLCIFYSMLASAEKKAALVEYYLAAAPNSQKIVMLGWLKETNEYLFYRTMIKVLPEGK